MHFESPSLSRLSFRRTPLRKVLCMGQIETGQTRSSSLVTSSCRNKPRPREHQSGVELLHQLRGATEVKRRGFQMWAVQKREQLRLESWVLVGDEGCGSHASFHLLMKRRYQRRRPEKFPRAIKTCLRSRASRLPIITHCASRNARLSGKGHIYFCSNWTQQRLIRNHRKAKKKKKIQSQTSDCNLLCHKIMYEFNKSIMKYAETVQCQWSGWYFLLPFIYSFGLKSVMMEIIQIKHTWMHWRPDIYYWYCNSIFV